MLLEIAYGILGFLFLCGMVYALFAKGWQYWEPHVMCYFGHKWADGDW